MPEVAQPPESHASRVQLVLIRSLVDRALNAADGSDVGVMSALLFADLAVETTLKAILVERGAKVDKASTFPLLMDALVREFPELASSRETGALRRLRDARNSVQHTGTSPSQSSAVAQLNDAVPALERVVRLGFGVDFAAVSVASLVGDTELRAVLEKASELCDSGDIHNATVCAAGAFESLRIRWGRWMRRALGLSEKHDRYGSWLVSPVASAVFGAEYEHLVEPTGEGPWRDLTLLSLGFSVPDLVFVRSAVEYAKRMRQDPPADPVPPPTTDSVRALVELLARHIWRIEVTHPEIFVTRP